jgi:hypothetical protein
MLTRFTGCGILHTCYRNYVRKKRIAVHKFKRTEEIFTSREIQYYVPVTNCTESGGIRITEI